MLEVLEAPSLGLGKVHFQQYRSTNVAEDAACGRRSVVGISRSCVAKGRLRMLCVVGALKPRSVRSTKIVVKPPRNRSGSLVFMWGFFGCKILCG